jgi:hypothetical protein
LYRLYRDDVPRGETGRARTTADVERNLAGTSLTRADLGWRSLLFARPTLPTLGPEPLGTVLLESQGLAVFRRADERIYVALDYGASGGGHGHPDRLNVLLSDGPVRWLDDMGTGSYVDPSLHWYRSTLAHNAPLFNGYEQQRVDGVLRAFEDRGQAGWISARAIDLYPGVSAIRTLVVMSDYVLEELAWYAKDFPTVVDLPIHLDSAVVSVRHPLSGDTHDVLFDSGERIDATLPGVEDIVAGRIPARKAAHVSDQKGKQRLDGFVITSVDGILYRVAAPGPPGAGRKTFLILRTMAFDQTGWVRIVWSWNEAVKSVSTRAHGFVAAVERSDGSHDRHTHTESGWRVERTAGTLRTRIDLGGIVKPEPPRYVADGERRIRSRTLRVGEPLEFQLGEGEYRRSDESWPAAGHPTAIVRILLSVQDSLIVSIRVRKDGALTFAPPNAANAYDNEAADINGDGVQLYFAIGNAASAWLLVPELRWEKEGTVRIRAIEGWTSPVHVEATWERTGDGYALQARIVFAPQSDFELGVVINEKPADRERRRGQLVLGGAPGFVYLRGDREDREQLSHFTIVQ